MAIKTETLTIKVSTEEKQRVKELALEKDISVSKMLYKIISKELFEEV